ncbi:MAG: 4Fe-4S binding protein [Nitrospirae bacterium]|nr:4Fe-4S binding protein [Nitrospirota bacterium]MCL5236988.1 4Fe-4S binding protein [Nitrospirota bacterium]
MEEKKELKVEDIKTAAEGKRCPVQKALYYISEFLSGPMCGKCFPCSMGSYEAKVRLQGIVDGEGTESDLRALRRIASEMAESSMCKKGKDSAKFIMEWMGTDVYREHLEGRCPDKECLALIEYRIITDACTMCGLCKDACKYGAILGEKPKPYLSGYMPYEVRQKRCVKCGECVKVCPEGAIIIVDAGLTEPVGVQ